MEGMKIDLMAEIEKVEANVYQDVNKKLKRIVIIEAKLHDCSKDVSLLMSKMSSVNAKDRMRADQGKYPKLYYLL